MSRRPITNLRTGLLAFGCALAISSSGLLFAETPPVPVSSAEAIALEVRAIFEQCKRSVIRVEATDQHGTLSGSGFFIDPNGTLFTAYTVGGESRDITVSIDDIKYPARRLLADPRSGVAILKIDAQTPFLSPGKSSDLRLASPVVAIGYPMDLPLTPSFGTVGGFDLKYLGRFFATTHIRANLPVQRGEGGAPLLNMRGEVVGILISSLDAGSATFALPIEAAEKIRSDLVRFGEIRPGWMGLKVVLSEQEVDGSRAKIEILLEGGPAQKAGLREGDFLIQIDHKPIHGIEDILDASFFFTENEEVTVKIVRDSKELEFRLQTSSPSTPSTQLPTQDSPIAKSPKRLPYFVSPDLSQEGLPLKPDR